MLIRTSETTRCASDWCRAGGGEGFANGHQGAGGFFSRNLRSQAARLLSVESRLPPPSHCQTAKVGPRRNTMTGQMYDKATTALLFVDPYNDFLSEGGKVWPRIQNIALEVGLLDNLRAIRAAMRRAGMKIFIVPHRRWQ